MDTDSQNAPLKTLLWKIPLIAAIYFFCKTIAATLVLSIGLRFPEMPGHSWNPFLDFLGGFVLVICLVFLARGIGGSLKKRWLILLAFSYVSLVINNQIEAVVFTTAHEVPTMLLFFILPCIVATGVTLALIKPPNDQVALESVFADRSMKSLWWRLLLAWLAFPVIYYFFGALIYPLVAGVYAQQDSGLQVPGQLVILGAVSVRSLFFLLASIPILVNWRRSRLGLVLSLAAAFTAMVGVTGLIESTWMPTQLRIVHSIEILADSLVHAWVLVALLIPKPKIEQAERVPEMGAVTEASN